MAGWLSNSMTCSILCPDKQSNPDHHTSEPYSHESSYDVLMGGIDGDGGRSSVENILNFDPWLMESNGIY